jgi:protein-tyrosine phosphatase
VRHRRRESRCRLSGRHRVPDVRGGARPPDRFAGALNFRDIGGYPVAGVSVTRWCAVYRSDSLHYLTDGDLAAFDAPGVKAVYDLRRPGEIARFPGPRDHVHLEIPSGDLATWPAVGLRTRRDGEEWLAADYLAMLARAAPAFGDLFARLADDGRFPAVVHCLGGKDRTGMAVALLLTALGADRGTVLDDYELTSRCHTSPRAGSGRGIHPARHRSLRR